MNEDEDEDDIMYETLWRIVTAARHFCEDVSMENREQLEKLILEFAKLHNNR